MANAKDANRDEISATKASQPDAEVTALVALCAAMEALPDPIARQRVLSWAWTRFVSDPPYGTTTTRKH